MKIFYMKIKLSMVPENYASKCLVILHSYHTLKNYTDDFIDSGVQRGCLNQLLKFYIYCLAGHANFS